MVKNIESSSKSSAPGDPTKESFFQRLDILYSISGSSNTSNPVSISSSMRKRNSFLEDPIKTHKHFKIPNLLFSRYVPWFKSRRKTML